MNGNPASSLLTGLLCLVYGAVMTLAFAPFDYFIIAILSPALLFHSILHAEPKKAFLYGYLFGLGMFGTGVNWLHISINLFGGMNLIGSLLITFLLVTFLALYPALVTWLGKKYFAESSTVLLLPAIPALWILSEWCRAWIFTGFPWLQLAYSQIDTPLNGLAAITGVYGMGWATVLSSTLLVYLYQAETRGKIYSAVTIVLLWSGCWFLSDINWTQKSGKEVSVALIQSAIPQKLKWLPEYRQKSLDLYLDLTDPFWGYDLIIWPETAIPIFYHGTPEFVNKLRNIAKANNTDILAGIPVGDTRAGKYYNSAVIFNDDTPTYHKRHLVPFGEYLPLKYFLTPVLTFLDIPMSDFSPGTQEKPVLAGSNIRIGISICYEDTFGEEVIQALPEADVLVNISNDAWFGDSIAPHQHLQMARMRALETGRYMLRATNTGITAIINEKGLIINKLKQFEPGVAEAAIDLYKGVTPYARMGNSPVITASLLLLMGIRWKSFRRNGGSRR